MGGKVVSEAGAEEGQAGMTQDPGQGKPRGSLEMGMGTSLERVILYIALPKVRSEYAYLHTPIEGGEKYLCCFFVSFHYAGSFLRAEWVCLTPIVSCTRHS